MKREGVELHVGGEELERDGGWVRGVGSVGKERRGHEKGRDR